MKIPCDQHIACPGDDLALTNFSSEDPDRFVYLGRSFGWNYVTPIDDDNIIIDGCTTFSSSPVSQNDADLCSDRHQQECQYQSPLPDPCQVCRPSGVGNQPASFGDFGFAAGMAAAVSSAPCCNPSDPAGCCCDDQQSDPDPDPGPGPDPGPDPNPNPKPTPKLYANDRQTCTVTCPDGTAYSSSIEAGWYVSTSKQQANEMALSAACKIANETRICPDGDQGGGNPCKVFCVGEEGSYQINATSRPGNPLTFSIADGSLPDGMTMDDHGLITGTPDSAGQAGTITVDICDDQGNCTSRDYCFIVMGIDETVLPDGAVDSAYSAQLHGTGGYPPYTWAVINGSTPDGVSMDVHGAFSGTPTKVGDFPFAVRITDHLGNACEGPVSIHINGVTNSDQTVRLDCTGGGGSVTVTIPAGTINHAPGYSQFNADSEARELAIAQASAQLDALGCPCHITGYSNSTKIVTGPADLGCQPSFNGFTFAGGVWTGGVYPMGGITFNVGGGCPTFFPCNLQTRLNCLGFPALTNTWYFFKAGLNPYDPGVFPAFIFSNVP